MRQPKNETYAKRDLRYDHYQPAYRTGYTRHGKYTDLQRDYEHSGQRASPGLKRSTRRKQPGTESDVPCLATAGKANV